MAPKKDDKVTVLKSSDIVDPSQYPSLRAPQTESLSPEHILALLANRLPELLYKLAIRKSNSCSTALKKNSVSSLPPDGPTNGGYTAQAQARSEHQTQELPCKHTSSDSIAEQRQTPVMSTLKKHRYILSTKEYAAAMLRSAHRTHIIRDWESAPATSVKNRPRMLHDS